jgi:precorrin-4/cobalt-precorrin-4 C11-methyltransferase
VSTGPLISFVGAGPGAADLLTLRGAARLGGADVVVWASSLVPEALLDHCRPGIEIHDSAGMTLEDVLAVYETHPEARIVRLHSGDPGLYGAIAEQIRWCREHNRAFEIVPGVTSVAATAASADAELTVPGIAQSVVFTRLAARTAASVPDRESVEAFARHGSTMAVFLSAARPQALQEALLADGSGYDATTPVVIGHRVSWPDERLVRTTVGDLAAALNEMDARMTTMILVGPALAAELGEVQRSHLYAPGFAHAYRRRSEAGSTLGRPQ